MRELYDKTIGMPNRNYPIGMSEILIGKKANQKPLEKYFGLIKATVLPTITYLFCPIDMKETCTFFSAGSVLKPVNKQNVNIENERCLSETWVTTELQEAKKQGYKIVQVYEIWHWPNKGNYLFRMYVDTFLKIKMEASGWPVNINEEVYIQKIRNNEGILIHVFLIFSHFFLFWFFKASLQSRQ